ncbi:ATP-binding cassette domain-containing protein [Neiella marina]|uniref:ATP-binding cassette domain-containing protein n=1 Tax=Neiella holothuriorum TaxID=2870530 RepID=A0ABS7EEI2_9GAMM|nr:ATP-binding cassette domain-containing protein [Neiella holothuriorum]MBW8190761.1 ATP-binding cassette domain-containing protein [Neiella holothuriorum]
MIYLDNVSKWYSTKKGEQHIFSSITFEIPTDHNIALLGSNGAGKSTLFRMLAGSEYPNKGQIKTDATISWPVALSTGIHPKMTGRENTRFIARVNGVQDLEEYEGRVQNFAELGRKYDLPVQSYSSGMRSRLAFSCCMGIDFDLYLIDEALSVGDKKFKRKAKRALLDKSRTANILMVSHEIDEIRLFCDSAIVIDNGELTFYNDLEEAIMVYEGE